MLISSSVEPPPHVTLRAGASPEAAGLPQRLQVQQGEKIPKRGEKESEICTHVWLCFITFRSTCYNYCTGKVSGLVKCFTVQFRLQGLIINVLNKDTIKNTLKYV